MESCSGWNGKAFAWLVELHSPLDLDRGFGYGLGSDCGCDFYSDLDHARVEVVASAVTRLA